MSRWMCTTHFRRGFTLIELLVVMAMVAILASLAAPAMRDVRTNMAISDAASNLQLALQQAQQSALKFNRPVIVAPLSGSDWKTGWRVFVRRDSSDTYTDGVDTLVSFQEALPSSVSLFTPSGFSACSLVPFAGSGFLRDNVSNCSVVFGSTVTNSYRHVIVARAGRARVCVADSASASACSPSDG